MKIKNYYQQMNEIYARLQDEESRQLFEARITYLFSKNVDDYMAVVDEMFYKWHFKSRLDQMSDDNLRGIILFGAGIAGKRIAKSLPILSDGKYAVSYFCDNNKCGEIIDGIKVLPVNDVVQNYQDYLVIIASYRYADSIYDELLLKGFPSSNVLKLGKQYFDIFEPYSDEVYVDAGAYDGDTVLDFCKWANGTYKKAYAFEPMREMQEVIAEKTKGLPNVEILNYATWNQREVLHFMENGTGSSISTQGGIEVEGLDIDSAVGDEKVTFIKMDIEGSELKALEGAKRTIISNKPRLAICIYHKPMDVIELPSYILELVPEYQFYIRHYCFEMGETVLYATAKGD